MLYITTRGNRDAFTAHRTLCTDIAPDGGYFLPMRFPRFSEKEIRLFVNGSFEETIASILNVFFSVKLTKWDVELCIGRNIARVLESNNKILIAELWHNSGNSFAYAINGLFSKVVGEKNAGKPSEWFLVAIKIAVLFGIYGELCRKSTLTYGQLIDLSVPADDFSYPIAALYAIEAGLPIGNIVCNCIDNHEVWNLIHRGSVNTHSLHTNQIAGIERYLLLRLGHSAVARLGNRVFETLPDEAECLRSGFYCAVSGLDRILYSINGTYTTTGHIASPHAALCLAGLGDYRAKIGESRLTLVLEEDSPILFAEQVEKATGISKTKMNEYLRDK